MTLQGVTIWKSKHKIENISASNTAMKLKLGVACYSLRTAPDGVYFDVAMATHPVPDCYYAGVVTPYLILSKHCPLPKG